MTTKSATNQACNPYLQHGDSDAAAKVFLDIITRPADQKRQKVSLSIADRGKLQWLQKTIEAHILH